MTYAARVDAQERWYLDNIPLKDQVVADVGANVGRLSQFFFDRVSRKGRVVSIEPIPSNIKAIEARIRRAGAKR
jgi:precorrin-6B methylase 2